MAFLNVEIKARCDHPEQVRQYLVTHHADFKGVDEQTDTYFNVPIGRLKLRQGNIENNLIYYERSDQPGPKDSHFRLLKTNDPETLKSILTDSLGIKVVVRKKREIYYLQNVKFHIDTVEGLGSFMEIEAGNLLADLPKEKLLGQCEYYLKAFSIRDEELIKISYSDMLMLTIG
jgi:adenylate cyclase, class 2